LTVPYGLCAVNALSQPFPVAHALLQRSLRQVQALPGFLDQLVDVRVLDDQRRRDNHGVAHRAHHQAVGHADVAAAGAGAEVLGEALAAGLVAHDLDGADQAQRAGLADDRVPGQPGPALVEIRRRVLLDPLDDLLAPQDAQVLQRHRAGGRVARIGVAVGELAAVGDDHLGHAVADQRPAQRQVARGHGLGEGHQVRLQVVGLAAEPLAGAAEAADDLVHDQQDVALGADAFDFRPVAVRRNDNAAGALHRLGDEGGHPVFAQFVDFFLQLARHAAAEILRVFVAALRNQCGWLIWCM
jgi:hypothetical protein